ncbi:uncharacterized protein TM35_000281080 [Trypanosoma theileri]|uniref:Uncharacterized protein n=1 Tax=Trypanosoma theileri TaxID=67003 RepID=A0A1X0NNU4_9TRYP|nr:uncharacterized protein TM35_000281080 [Trypanosoma theileri]ORC86392.1 hypothetical protein TM35_000281080 [Trypanosoma theileri]
MSQTEDVEGLQKRLQVSEEWNMRLQSQIQELLRLPRSEVEAMRGRMQNPDIAIPLLQCYDAAILEKQEENERLVIETNRLKTQLEAAGVELQDARAAQQEMEVRLQEAHSVQQQREEQLNEQLHEAQRSSTRIQHELSRSLDAEATLRRDVERLQQQLAELQHETTHIQEDNAALQEAALQASRRLKSTASAAEATQQAGEVQRVQLQLLSKENADKLQELERLRLRMVQALRLASENHAIHMKAVEERHRVAMETLRQQAATQEAEVLKLRAQLARVDASSPHCSKNNSHLRSTTELLEAQTRQALEVEVKRLYGEVSAMQMQRDDAMLRYEQLSNSLRREESDRMAAVQRETQMLQQKIRDQEQQYQQLDMEYNRTKEELRLLREKCKGYTTELQNVRQEQDQSLRKVEELRRALTTAEETCEQVRRKAKEDIAGERKRVQELEQHVEGVARDMQSSKDRAHAATLTAERQCEELRHQLTEAQERVKTAQTRLSTREREVEVLTANVQHLQEAVRLNQQQALACDGRVQQLLQQDEEKSRKLREMTLLVERLKMEGARAARARDRLIEDVSTRMY